MRSALDRLYDLAAYAAGVCLFMIFVTIIVQVAGTYVGLYVRGTDAIAGYFMAGASFLALAHTLRRGEHIRVTLFLDRIGNAAARRAMELLCLAVAAALSLFFAWYSWTMTWWSYAYNAISDAQDRTPLWIPQVAMAVGVSILAIAFIDELVSVLRGRAIARPASDSEPARVE